MEEPRDRLWGRQKVDKKINFQNLKNKTKRKGLLKVAKT